MNKKQLAGDALKQAISLRHKMDVGVDEAVDAINIAERLNIEVRLVDLPSMEGIYAPSTHSQIYISCLRPMGRRNFTCAHEIGHYIFKHGEKFDEIRSESKLKIFDPHEYLADCFAGYLLMPRLTILNALSIRKLILSEITSVQIYQLSNWLNVGYRTLINQMAYSYGILDIALGELLVKTQPKLIRKRLFEPSEKTNLHWFDEFWKGRAIDCEAGDYIAVPIGTLIEGNGINFVHSEIGYSLLIATKPGLGKVTTPSGNAAFVRVSCKQYVGLSNYRHEEEVE